MGTSDRRGCPEESAHENREGGGKSSRSHGATQRRNSGQPGSSQPGTAAADSRQAYAVCPPRQARLCFRLLPTLTSFTPSPGSPVPTPLEAELQKQCW